jgi:DNA-directed RNA polymerase subunit beta
MQVTKIRDFSRYGDAIDVPDLIEIQTEPYARFLQAGVPAAQRKVMGLEALLHEVYPIGSYDGSMKLEYLDYELDPPRYTPDECRELGLTYGMPFRVKVRLHRKGIEEVQEESIYLGEIPIMIGGGEFVVNGSERVIVSQLHRSPGVDFVKESAEGDRALHACRIIPERGSWIEINVTRKDILAVRIDQSSKIPATTFLRAMSAEYGTTEALVRAFYAVKTLRTASLKPDMWAAAAVVDPDTGEELVGAGRQIGEVLNKIRESAVKQVDVIAKLADAIILNTLAEDSATSHEEALLKIYARLRPGNPVQLDKARKLFQEKFYDETRYRLGKVGRFRLNRKFEQGIPESEMVLRPEDFVSSLRYLLALRAGEGQVDDIDHLGNRRLKTIDELATDELRKGFLKLKRTVQERMSLKDPETIDKVAELVNTKSVSSSIDFFFGRSELSQVVDQTNPLAQLTHERRLSALGPGGLNRKRAGFEVRDVHISHYGRICPIETPEGVNIGLIASLGIYSSIDEYGFLTTPYRKVTRGKVDGEVVYLRADEEMRSTLAPPDVVESENDGRQLPETETKEEYLARRRDAERRRKTAKIKEGTLLGRMQGDLRQVPAEEIAYVDISPKQTVGVSAALIPFLEHDDANRALMGSNMQRQAVPLVRIEPPIISTGMERPVAENSGMVVRARKGGAVTYADACRIVIDDTDEYALRKFVGLNERTCLNQRPVVRPGQKVKTGQVIADGAGTHQGELALGRNILVAFMTFDGYNFEDAILISERLVKTDAFTSVHVEAHDIEIRETKLGREEFTRDIPNVSERALRNLDERGIVRVGTRVGASDILVGKVSPKSKTELSPEEKLLHAIFGRAGEDVKNDSLELPAGQEGIVIGAKHFSRRTHLSDEQKKDVEHQIKAFQAECDEQRIHIFRRMIQAIEDVTEQLLVDPNTRQKVGKSENPAVILEQIGSFSLKWVKPATLRPQAEADYNRYWPCILDIGKECERRLGHMKRGDELPSGVLEMVKVYVATKRTLSVGDKMAGRHGNKGVIAKIMPDEDMPFLEDGTPVDIVLNPLGVPSRMNVGQIFETHLGWAAAVLDFQVVTPVFDGATEAQIRACLDEANAHVRRRREDVDVIRNAGRTGELLTEMPLTGKVTLHDGRTGEPFDQPVTVGYIYMLKLHHLVDDKIHARSTGPYSLITQQPLGGKARTGGQRFGEMEVWGLEAYGAAYILQELLTVKSDDVEGRTKIYESMVKGTHTLDAGTPVSFDVLCNEIRGLGLNIQLEKRRLL